MNLNSGHGHVRPRPDGVKAGCVCSLCAFERGMQSPPRAKVEGTVFENEASQVVPEHLLYVSFVRELVRPFFDGDEFKVKAWMEAINPLLGDVSPEQMIREGRHRKLVKFIQTAISENSAP